MRPETSQLHTIPLFDDLSEDDQEHIASLMEVRHVDAGKRFTPQGGAGYEFFVIEEGARIRATLEERLSAL